MSIPNTHRCFLGPFNRERTRSGMCAFHEAVLAQPATLYKALPHATGLHLVHSVRWALWSPFKDEKTEAYMKLDQGCPCEDTKEALQPKFLSLGLIFQICRRWLFSRFHIDLLDYSLTWVLPKKKSTKVVSGAWQHYRKKSSCVCPLMYLA